MQEGDVLEHEGDLLLVLRTSKAEIVVLALDVESHYNESFPGSIEHWPFDNGADRVVNSAKLLFRREE